ncbi:unnamed protein product [Blepharisma stoltei]|uniref:Uncharacterized protein n=1 Tax=Blepharisma stoltei TaxID=1481888 RepID=A0AAU9JXG0_9CILI|nr:unnamed protein product [Blepharisma stoltei]
MKISIWKLSYTRQTQRKRPENGASIWSSYCRQVNQKVWKTIFFQQIFILFIFLAPNWAWHLTHSPIRKIDYENSSHSAWVIIF